MARVAFRNRLERSRREPEKVLMMDNDGSKIEEGRAAWQDRGREPAVAGVLLQEGLIVEL